MVSQPFAVCHIVYTYIYCQIVSFFSFRSISLCYYCLATQSWRMGEANILILLLFVVCKLRVVRGGSYASCCCSFSCCLLAIMFAFIISCGTYIVVVVVVSNTYFTLTRFCNLAACSFANVVAAPCCCWFAPNAINWQQSCKYILLIFHLRVVCVSLFWWALLPIKFALRAWLAA